MMLRSAARIPVWLSFALALLLLLPGVGMAGAQEPDAGSFVIRVGSDTIAVERFSREAGRLAGVLSGQMVGTLQYSAELSPDGGIPRLELSVRAPATSPTGAPLRRATVTIEGDSAIVELRQGNAEPQVQRFDDAGSFPYLNLSFAFLEQLVRRADALSGSPVNLTLFNVSGGTTLPATIIRGTGDSVGIALGGVEIEARVDAAGRLLGARIPAQNLTVERTGEAVSLALSAPDYSAPSGAPYTAEEVSIAAPSGHRLAGTLTLPKDAPGPVPAVVLISGSGPQDRDESMALLPGYRPFRQLADTLARRGFATLRFDDRGVGSSTGDYAAATSEDFADDVRAALAYLRRREEVDPERLALLGHSEGALIAPMIAAGDSALGAIVLLAAPSRPGREILSFQNRYAIEGNPDIPPAARDSLLAAAMLRVDSLSAVQPWIRFFLEHDPRETAQQVSVPVLILQGATDRQVPAEQAVELAGAFREGGNPDVTVRVLPAINHLFLPDPSGDPAGYTGLTDRNVSPDVLGVITDWLAERLP